MVRYAKETSWATEFATAAVRKAGNAWTVPQSAIVREGETNRVYVQRTPEAFELRAVKVGKNVGANVEVTEGLKDGERIVVTGADKMPRK